MRILSEFAGHGTHIYYRLVKISDPTTIEGFTLNSKARLFLHKLSV